MVNIASPNASSLGVCIVHRKLKLSSPGGATHPRFLGWGSRRFCFITSGHAGSSHRLWKPFLIWFWRLWSQAASLRVGETAGKLTNNKRDTRRSKQFKWFSKHNRLGLCNKRNFVDVYVYLVTGLRLYLIGLNELTSLNGTVVRTPGAGLHKARLAIFVQYLYYTVWKTKNIFLSN